MLNHKQTAVVLMIGLVAVLMTSASTRVFAQPTLPPSQIQTDENKVNNALQADENKIATDENKIATDEHALGSKITHAIAVDASGGFQ